MQAPWYFGAEQATLNHQRIKPDMIKTYNAVDDWYKRGVKEVRLLLFLLLLLLSL